MIKERVFVILGRKITVSVMDNGEHGQWWDARLENARFNRADQPVPTLVGGRRGRLAAIEGLPGQPVIDTDGDVYR